MEPMPTASLPDATPSLASAIIEDSRAENRAATPVGRFSLQHDPGIRLRPPGFRRRWPGKRDSPDSTSKPA